MTWNVIGRIVIREAFTWRRRGEFGTSGGLKIDSWPSTFAVWPNFCPKDWDMFLDRAKVLRHEGNWWCNGYARNALLRSIYNLHNDVHKCILNETVVVRLSTDYSTVYLPQILVCKSRYIVLAKNHDFDMYRYLPYKSNHFSGSNHFAGKL